jgi:hypothetical protein
LAGVVALSDIAATLRGPARCRTSQQHAARSSALSAITTTPRGPARCRPSQQRREVQRVVATVPEERYKLQCVAGQRRNNAASCNAPGHRCSVARSCSVAPPPAIAATMAEIYTSDVGLSSDLCRTSVQLSSVELPSDVRPCVIADVIILRPC